MKNSTDIINHPPHYTDGGIETIDFIEAKNLPYHLGNVVKYISRAGKKDDLIKDLKKAKWYLDRYLRRLDGGGPSGADNQEKPRKRKPRPRS